MEEEIEINIYGAVLLCQVIFRRYNEEEVIIDIESVKCGDLDVLELIDTAEYEKLKDTCESRFQHQIFRNMMEREERITNN